MLLPWEYGIRNLTRRPVRSGLTLAALSIVVLLIMVVVGFIRGLEVSLADSGDPDVVLIYSVTSGENIESSAIAARTPGLVTSSVAGTVQRYGITFASPEIYLGTRILDENGSGGLGLIRAVTETSPLVRRHVRLVEGKWPLWGEVIVGNLAAAKLGLDPSLLQVGKKIAFEGQDWTISGRFVAAGTAFESEIWCSLSDFQAATKRQDISLVALLLPPKSPSSELTLFCKERTDLELQAVRETDYYAALQQYYRPVRLLAWLVVLLVSGAGLFAGMNMMYGSVAGRIREIATLQAVGYRRPVILLSLIQEGVVLAAASSLLSALIAVTLMNGYAVRFTMGAFALRIDSFALIIGCGAGLLLGALGALPPAIKALRQSVAECLKAI
jgi:putative ABC transport system permease protein